jgi:hypothetical protein
MKRDERKDLTNFNNLVKRAAEKGALISVQNKAFVKNAANGNAAGEYKDT